MNARKIGLFFVVPAVVLYTVVFAFGQAQPSDSVPRVHGIGLKDLAVHVTKGSASAGTNGNTNMVYDGGPVLNASRGTNLYYIWYGNWPASSNARKILNNFAAYIGGSPYFNINTTYYDYNPDGAVLPVLNKVNFGGSVDDNYSLGSSLSINDVYYVVANAILAHQLPADPNGVYFVLTSADVIESGFCSLYCAFHASAAGWPLPLVDSVDIKVGFVGNPDQCPYACEVQVPSPNNNPGADSMANAIAHELEESVTDPDGTAWHTPNYFENADLCAWTFGCSITSLGFTFPGPAACPQTSNGASYNMKLGLMDYAIQRNWVNSGKGYCGLSYP